MTDDFEGRVRRQLHDEVGDPPPAPELWDRTQHRIAQRSRRTRIGALAAVLLVAATAAVGVSALSGGDDGTRVVADSDDQQTGFVALTLDGQLRRYGPDGSDRGLIAETGWHYDDGDDYPPPPTFTVAPDGTVYFDRPAENTSCDRADPRGFEIVSVPLEGGDPAVVVDVGASPAASPDGRRLAYLTARSGSHACSNPDEMAGPGGGTTSSAADALVLEVLDLTGSRALPSMPVDLDVDGVSETGILLDAPMIWAPDGSRIALSVLTGSIVTGNTESNVEVVDVDTGARHSVYKWGGGLGRSGGRAVAFADDADLFVDASDFEGTSVKIGQVPTGGADPVPNDQTVTVIHEIANASYLRTLSALPGDDAPGLLAVVEKNASPNGAGPVVYFGTGQGGEQRTLTTDVVAAAWIPGTTASDLVAPTVPTGFVALTGDGELHRYGPAGEERGLVADTGWKPGSNFSKPTFSVAPDGTVYFSRAVTDPECSRSEQFGSEIVSVPLDGGEPQVVAPVGSSPAVSPDGTQLAFTTTGHETQCYRSDGGDTSVLAVHDLGSSEFRKIPIHPGNEVPDLLIPNDYPVAWSPDGSEIAAKVLLGAEQRAAVAVVDLDTQAARTVFLFSDGDGGPALAYADTGQLALDATRTAGDGSGWIGLTDVDVSEPATVDTMAVPQFIGLPDQQRLLMLSTLAGETLARENGPGLLVTTAPGLNPQSGTAYVYSEGQEGTPRVAAEDVLAAAWIP